MSQMETPNLDLIKPNTTTYNDDPTTPLILTPAGNTVVGGGKAR